MAEFLTMAEAEDKFGKKGRTNAALTLGIIGTALGAFSGNNGGCGCGNGGGLLGNLFGGNNNCCAMQQAEQAKTLAMAQGQQANDLAWSNRVQSLQDDIDLYTYINGRNLATNERIGNETQVLTNQIWKDLLKATCALQSEGMAVANNLQRQLDHKIDGQLKYAYSDLCAPVPSIAPLYCSPFTSYGTGMYAGTAAANFNAVNTAINTVADRCPSCTAQ